MTVTAAGGPPLAVLGSGRAGGGLASLLAARGWPVAAVWSRRGARARALASRVRRSTAGAVAPAAPTHPQQAADRARAVLLAVPDDALPDLARRLAADRRTLRGQIFLHLSGTRPVAVLAPLAALGADTGGLHPLAVFPAAMPGPDLLEGVLFAVDGSGAARRLAGRLARALGGRARAVPAGARAAYHLAAAMVANDGVALFALALERMKATGWPEAEARRGLARLLAGAARELARGRPERVLTGPVARGDTRTIARHLKAAGRRETRTLHALLSLVLVRLARQDGRLDADSARRLERLLGPAAGR